MAEEPGRKLRVLHLILVLGEANGQYNEHCLPLMDERDISICTFFPPQLTPPPQIALFAGDGTVRGFFRALRRALDDRRHDIVHAHAPHSALMLVMALLGWRRFRAVAASLVYTVQDSFYDYKPRNQLMMVLALPWFARVVFCSHSAYESVPRPWKRLVRGRWRVVQNGADLERVDRAVVGPRAQRGDDDRFRVVCVGRFEPVKDQACVVDAFAQGGGPDSRLTLIGRGSLETSVRARIEALGLSERVEMTGLIPRDEVFRRCADADVFVSASHGEGLPVAVIEAMATGCPVVLSDIPPHREVADGADFVPLVPVGNAAGFARELERIRGMSGADRRALGRRCREHVIERFSLPTMHANLDRVYAELVSDLVPAGSGT
jgi:glycosyltransferase involved in cell wall biosynthesis